MCRFPWKNILPLFSAVSHLLAHLGGSFWGPLGAPLPPLWVLLGASWAHLALLRPHYSICPSWGLLRRSWNSKRLPGPFGAHSGSILYAPGLLWNLFGCIFWYIWGDHFLVASQRFQIIFGDACWSLFFLCSSSSCSSLCCSCYVGVCCSCYSAR